MAARTSENKTRRNNRESQFLANGDASQSPDDERRRRHLGALLGAKLAIESLGFQSSHRNDPALWVVAYSQGFDDRRLATHLRRTRTVLRQSRIRDRRFG